MILKEYSILEVGETTDRLSSSRLDSPFLIYPATSVRYGTCVGVLAYQKIFSEKLFCMGKVKNAHPTHKKSALTSGNDLRVRKTQKLIFYLIFEKLILPEAECIPM